MIQNYIDLNRRLRKIVCLCWDAVHPQTEDDTLPYICSYLQQEVRDLERLWPQGLTKKPLANLRDSAKRCDPKDCWEIIEEVMPKLEDALDYYFSSQPTTDITSGIVDFLHPAIIKSSYAQFRDGQYRDAVLNAIMAVFELIRKKTKIDKDGSELVCEVLSLSKPKLIISNLKTDSGRNEQKGYLQILQGAYLGIRNPKAHSLSTDLDKPKTAQYLIFASLLARRIDEAIIAD